MDGLGLVIFSMMTYDLELRFGLVPVGGIGCFSAAQGGIGSLEI